MEPAWYVLNYHDINWETSPMIRGIGGTVAPDIFRQHLHALSRRGDLISVTEGLDRLETGRGFSRPAFSVWFDDGYAGVREHALPICASFGITAAISVCSRFVLRQEMFWRAALSCLVSMGARPEVERRLRPLGYTGGVSLRAWTLAHFSTEVAQLVLAAYRDCVSEDVQQDAFRIFDTSEGLAKLSAGGWIVANHSAAHYPHLENSDAGAAQAQFLECEDVCRQLGAGARIWVLPFDGQSHADPCDAAPVDGMVVRVQARANTVASFGSRRLYRFPVIWQRRSAFPVEALA